MAKSGKRWQVETRRRRVSRAVKLAWAAVAGDQNARVGVGGRGV